MTTIAFSAHPIPPREIFALGAAAFDRAYALDIMELFKTFHEAGTTVIVAAHDETLMADYGHRILRLQEGRFAA